MNLKKKDITIQVLVYFTLCHHSVWDGLRVILMLLKDSEKGAEYYWNLFEKVRMTFPENGADMLAFIY